MWRARGPPLGRGHLPRYAEPRPRACRRGRPAAPGPPGRHGRLRALPVCVRDLCPVYSRGGRGSPYLTQFDMGGMLPLRAHSRQPEATWNLVSLIRSRVPRRPRALLLRTCRPGGGSPGISPRRPQWARLSRLAPYPSRFWNGRTNRTESPTSGFLAIVPPRLRARRRATLATNWFQLVGQSTESTSSTLDTR